MHFVLILWGLEPQKAASPPWGHGRLVRDALKQFTHLGIGRTRKIVDRVCQIASESDFQDFGSFFQQLEIYNKIKVLEGS